MSMYRNVDILTSSPGQAPKDGKHVFVEHPRGGLTTASFDGKKFVRADGTAIAEPEKWKAIN